MSAGYLEIYTTIFGWQFYGLLWQIFTDTGLIYAPFIAALWLNWRDPFVSQDDKPAAVISTRRMLFDVITMFLVIALTATPSVNLRISDINTQKNCTNQNIFQGGNTGTTYDDMNLTISELHNTKIPLFWYTVIALGSGINSSIIQNLPCISNLRDWDSLLRTSSIQDPILRHEYSRFYSECYVPAKAKLKYPVNTNYLNQQKESFLDKKLTFRDSPRLPVNMETIEKEFYESLRYIAPEFFLETEGFYKPCTIPRICGVGGRARYDVHNWPFELPRDGDYNQYERDLAAQGDKYGKPYCNEWWKGHENQPTIGLEHKLVQAAASTDGTKLSTLATQIKSNLQYTNDWDTNRQIIQSLLRNGPPEWTGGNFGLQTTTDKVLAGAIGVLSANQIAGQLTGFHTAMVVVKEGAPIAQALVLMTVYMFIVVYLILARYQVESLIFLATIIIAIKCWPALWTIAEFIDANLFKAMYPDPNVLGGPSGLGLKRIILNIMTTSLFVIFPLTLTWIMAWAGMSGARFIGDGIDSLSSPGKSMGNTAGAGATKKTSGLISKAATKGKSGK